MAEKVILIVDLGHDQPELIQADVESFGVKAIICPHNLMSEEEVFAYGDVKGFIFNGGPHKKEGGFRVVAYPIFAELQEQQQMPAYSVDYSGFEGVNLFSWPEDEGERRAVIAEFLKDKCKLI